MIPFETSRVPDFDITVQKGTESDRKKLLSLKREASLGQGVDVVYIYSLAELEIPYPNCAGNIAYIGAAGRPSEPTGKRFSQHICTSENEGGDTGSNFTLSRYYWLGHKLHLKIFRLWDINDAPRRLAVELALLQQHLKIFGALPIAQGASGERYTTSLVTAMAVQNVLAGPLATAKPAVQPDGSAFGGPAG